MSFNDDDVVRNPFFIFFAFVGLGGLFWLSICLCCCVLRQRRALWFGSWGSGQRARSDSEQPTTAHADEGDGGSSTQRQHTDSSVGLVSGEQHISGHRGTHEDEPPPSYESLFGEDKETNNT